MCEETGLTLLHHDRDFATIARVTGRPERLIDLRR
jgi:predicted nucleic acid-binding protein